MKKSVRLLSPVFALLMMFAIAFNASADWNSEVSAGSKVTLSEEDPFVVDTFAGVNSLYSKNNTGYTSSELVTRFYKEAFNMPISTSGSGPVANNQGYVFQPTNTPAQGDIVYSPSTGRWAIVKSYAGKTITLFEQDTAAGDYAVKGRTIKYPSNSYTVYTPKAKTGNAYPVLKDAKTGATIRTATGRVDSSISTTAANETTSVASSDSPESTSSSGEITTTSAMKTEIFTDYTTFANNESPVTTEPPTFTTSPMPSGYEEFYTEESQSQPELFTYEYYTDFGTQADESTTHDIMETSAIPEDHSIDPTLIFGIAMVGGIVCITAAGILAGVAIKKRNDEDDE